MSVETRPSSDWSEIGNLFPGMTGPARILDDEESDSDDGENRVSKLEDRAESSRVTITNDFDAYRVVASGTYQPIVKHVIKCPLCLVLLDGVPAFVNHLSSVTHEQPFPPGKTKVDIFGYLVDADKYFPLPSMEIAIVREGETRDDKFLPIVPKPDLQSLAVNDPRPEETAIVGESETRDDKFLPIAPKPDLQSLAVKDPRPDETAISATASVMTTSRASTFLSSATAPMTSNVSAIPSGGATGGWNGSLSGVRGGAVHILPTRVRTVGRATTNQDDISCLVCGKIFSEKTDLLRHVHLNNCYRNHVCVACGKGFHQEYRLVEHSYDHTGVRPYKCNICFNRSFRYHSSYILHQHSHAETRMFSPRRGPANKDKRAFINDEYINIGDIIKDADLREKIQPSSAAPMTLNASISPGTSFASTLTVPDWVIPPKSPPHVLQRPPTDGHSPANSPPTVAHLLDRKRKHSRLRLFEHTSKRSMLTSDYASSVPDDVSERWMNRMHDEWCMSCGSPGAARCRPLIHVRRPPRLGPRFDLQDPCQTVNSSQSPRQLMPDDTSSLSESAPSCDVSSYIEVVATPPRHRGSSCQMGNSFQLIKAEDEPDADYRAVRCD